MGLFGLFIRLCSLLIGSYLLYHACKLVHIIFEYGNELNLLNSSFTEMIYLILYVILWIFIMFIGVLFGMLAFDTGTNKENDKEILIIN